MPIAEVKVPQKGVVQKALQNNVLVARCSCIVYTTEAICTAGGEGSIRRNVSRVVLDGVSEELVVLSFSSCTPY